MQSCKEFDFNTWSRVLAVGGAILLMLVGVWSFTDIGGAMWCIFFSLVVFCIELPFCCACCLGDCIDKLAFMEPSPENPKAALIRGIVYSAFSVIGFLLAGAFTQYIVLIVMSMASIFYVGAYFQDLGGGPGLTSNADFATAGKGHASDYARDNPDQVAAAAKSGAQYAKENPDVARAALNAV